MTLFVRRLVLGVALGAGSLLASPAWAQRLDVGAGYQYFHAPDINYPAGFNIDLSLGLSDNFRIVGEVGRARHNEDESYGTLTATNFGAGFRFASDTPGWAPYVQLIAGGHRDTFESLSDTNFMLQPGAGITFPLGSTFGIFGQADYRRIFYEISAETDYRFLAGIRLARR